MANITGNNLLDDSLSGTSGADIVQGLGGNDTLLGRGGNDSLEGGDGNDYLNGGTGTNTLAGGAGDDIYELTSATDVVVEAAGEGRDSVRAWIDSALADNVEDLELLGTARDGVGNALDNRVFGNNVANGLDGRDGNDSLDGRAGNDTLQGGAGNDTLQGGADNDSLYGEAGDDYLAGGAGNNVLSGGAGDDLYELSGTVDTIAESAGEGHDTARVWINGYSLDANVEDMDLYGAVVVASGNDGDNRVTGSGTANEIAGQAGNDTIEGRGGADTLVGGIGSDMLYGGAQNDELRGDAEADLLDGGTGADHMYGGDGNDTYVIDNALDQADESTGSGIDAVWAGINYTLGSTIEKLILLQLPGVYSGTGNALDNDIAGNTVDNVLRGNGGNDTLAGLAGNDTLRGDGGNDLLQGGAGNDTYMAVRGGGVNVIEDAGTGETDRVRFGAANVTHRQLWFTQSGDDLLIRVVGTAGSDRVLNYFTDTSHGWQVQLGDGATLDRSAIDQLVSAMAAVTWPAGTTIPTTGEHAALSDLVNRLWYNQAPSDITLDNTAINENSPAGTLVGNLGAVDPDAGDSATFTLLDDAGGRFEVVGSELRVAAGAGLDYEVSAVYDINVRVTDGGGLTFDRTFTVALNNITGSIVGTAGNDVLDRTGEEDVILADGGNDIITPGSANDTIDGGDGDDLVLYGDDTTGYAISASGGEVLVQDTDLSNGGDGTDHLSHVERLQFGDGSVLTVDFAERRVNATATGNQAVPAVAALADGGSIVVWSSPDGSGLGVYMQRFDVTGHAVGSETRVNTYGTSDQWSPTVAGLADGGFVVGWHSLQDGSYTGSYLQRFSSTGATVGSETRINNHTPNSQSWPVLAGLSGGGYVATWNSSAQDPGGDWGVYRKQYDSSGALVVNENLVADSWSGNQYTPVTAALADGGYVIAWHSPHDGTGNGFGIFYKIYSAAGVQELVETRANVTVAGDQHESAVAGLGNGGFVLAWSSNGQDGSGFGIYARMFNAEGVATTGEIAVNSYTSADQFNPSVTTLSDGGFVVAWDSQNQDGSSDGIYLRRFDAAGNASGGEVRVADYTSGAQTAPAVTELQDGSLLVTWQSDGQDGSEGGIYSQRFDVDGSRIATELALAVTATAATGTDRSDVVTGNALDNTLRGGGGHDTVSGGGGGDSLYGDAGVDVLLGGDGDDGLAYDGSDRLDGGVGTDTLVLASGIILIDLTAIGIPDIAGIERVDISAGGNNTLTVNLSEVLAISTESDTLTVFGDAGDTVQRGSGWSANGTQVVDGHVFNRYEQATAVLLVEQGITVA